MLVANFFYNATAGQVLGLRCEKNGYMKLHRGKKTAQQIIHDFHIRVEKVETR